MASRSGGRRIVVRSWEEFLGHIVDGPFASWAFRGQADAGWPLATSLGRHLSAFAIDARVWRSQEERALRIFTRKAPNLLPAPPGTDDHLQWLALMEHHGAPTRLLDCTWSPYVAAFFALELATGDAGVWAIDPLRVRGRALRAAGLRRGEQLDPRLPRNFERHFLGGRRPFVWIGEPERMNRRLVAQSGTFLIPSVLDRTIDRILLDDPVTRDALALFVLPARLVRERALRQLYAMNVTRATLFPDLDGLAGSLAYELEFHWGYDPRRPAP